MTHHNEESFFMEEEVTSIFENLSTYSFVDPNNRQVVSPDDTLAVTGMQRDEDCYRYFDFGVDHFGGDFEVNMKIRNDGEAGGLGHFFVMANVLDDVKDIGDAAEPFLYFQASNTNGSFWRAFITGDSAVFDSTTSSLEYSTDYWLNLVRVDSGGANGYGTYVVTIYEDEAKTIIFDTLAIDLVTAKRDYRYLYAMNSFNSGNPNVFSGITSEVEIVAP